MKRIVIQLIFIGATLLVLGIACVTAPDSTSDSTEPQELRMFVEVARNEVIRNGYESYDGEVFVEAEENYQIGITNYGADNELSTQRLQAALNGYNRLIGLGGGSDSLRVDK